MSKKARNGEGGSGESVKCRQKWAKEGTENEKK